MHDNHVVSSKCSCGRFFEQHPTIIEDTEDESLEIFLQALSQGFCRCFNSRQPGDDVHYQTAGKTWLHVASALGLLDMVRLLVTQAKIDINAVSFLYNFTCLSLAVMQTNAELVSWLCGHPDVNVNIKAKSEQHSPLIDAMLAEKYHIVDILCHSPGIDLNATNFRNETPLIIAVRMNNAQLVKQLLSAGADYSIPAANGVLPFFLAIHSSRQVLEEFIRAKVPVDSVSADQETALYLAVRDGSLAFIHLLLEAGACPHFKPTLPVVVLAASLGHWNTVAYLLDRGEDPNQFDERGWTPLHYASMQGLFMIVNLLLDCGADVNCLTASSNTPLSLAVFHRHIEVVELLLSNQCDVNTQDGDLDTALHFAAFHGDPDLVSLLLNGGAQTDLQNKVCATPLFNAVMGGSTNVFKLLLPYYTDTQLHTKSQGFTYSRIDVKSHFMYPLPRSPLWIATSTQKVLMVNLLLYAGYNLSSEYWICDGPFPTDMGTQEAMMLHNILLINVSVPRSLVSQARIVVRRALGPDKQRHVNQLRLIPRKVKNFIILRDIDDTIN
ncbi:hypothetical protein Btru_048948 [Bulinus truncatus]|nr:hypothetical protein Btru_048948 [Bulinus truncatus]